VTKINVMKRYLILLLVVLGACSTPLVEVVEETYEDGSPKKISFYKNFKKDKILVKEILYYPNKNKKLEGEYKDMKRDGKWTYWYENGNKWSEGHYKMGVDNGVKTVWYENGEKYYEGKTKDGERVGVWLFWDEDKHVAKEIDYDK